MNKSSYPYFYDITINEIENGYKLEDLPYYYILYKYSLDHERVYTSKIYNNLKLEFNIPDNNHNSISLIVL